jgi:hypothetical protein
MTSFRQTEANRRNARKSTGPNTPEGKRRSRCNALRHGLTAETVIGALEDAEDYQAFEATIVADYDAQSAVERELVLRLASLLWRLRRATTIETGLFEMQANHLSEFRQARYVLPASREVVYAMFGRANPPSDLLSILPSSSRVAFCVLPICPTSHSTASAAMKQPFGAKSAGFYTLSMPWIDANHKKEDADAISMIGQNYRTFENDCSACLRR